MKRYTLWISLVGSLLSLSLFIYLFFHFPEQPKVFGSLPFDKFKEEIIHEPIGEEAPSGKPPRPALFLPEVPVEIQAESSPVLSGKPLFYLVIDDVGSDKSVIDSFLELDFPITFAIMPHIKKSIEGYNKILAKGQEPILHMPMQPLNGSFAGRGQIELGDSPSTIGSKLAEAFAPFPEIRGLNNHMGSAVTSSRSEISAVLDYAKAHNLFFVDSFTIANSLGVPIGKEKGMQVARRDVFLDNISTEEAINGMLDQALRHAKSQKRVVVIGHIWSQELANVLKTRQEELKNTVEFRFISTYFKDTP